MRSILVLAAFGLAVAAAAPASADTARSVSTPPPLGKPPVAAAGVGGPALNTNFADPDVIRVGSTYHAYATNGNGKHIQHATSTTLTSWALDPVDMLPTLGAWADPNWQFPGGGIWAPDVSQIGGRYVMYYVAHDIASDKQCIGAATAAGPGGPFTPAGAGPIVCTPDQGGSIDASSYVEGSQHYILFKNDGNCCAQDTWLQLQPVRADGLATSGPAVKLVKQDQPYEGSLVEAPVLWHHGGHYVLFYSAAAFDNDSYVTSYATATTLTGPYTKAHDPLLSTDKVGGLPKGPGGEDIVTDTAGRDHIVFHGWDAGFTRRAMYVADLGWANDLPVVRGAKVRYEAEDATLTHCTARGATGANNGRAVGHIDFADSTVRFSSVYAPRAGTYTLYVRYGNGSLNAGGQQTAATHTLAVNDVSAGVVTLPYTGWDNWTTVSRTIALAEGWNSLTFGKGDYYAELDSIDVA